MAEEWRDIPNYENKYLVSNLGNVKSLNYRGNTNTEHKLTFDTSSGYARVTLFDKNGCRKKFSVHFLVAITFISNPNKLPCINHKDENKLNNEVSNLEWCTHKYNSNYGTAIERTKSHSQKVYEQRRKPVCQYDFDGNFINIFSDGMSAAKWCKVKDNNPGMIFKCCKGLIRQAYGYQWKYKTKNYKQKIKSIRNSFNIYPIVQYSIKSSRIPPSIGYKVQNGWG